MKNKWKDLVLTWTPRIYGFILGLHVAILYDSFNLSQCTYGILCYILVSGPIFGILLLEIIFGAIVYLKLAEKLES